MPLDVKESLQSPIWREIYFAKILGKKYPQHFMKLYDYKIDDKCYLKKYGLAFTWKNLPKQQQKYYNTLYKSSYCSIKLWSYIDTTLRDLLKSWKTFHKNIFYDLLIQIVYIIYLINKEGFLHNDFTSANIGLVKTKKKYIKIMNSNVKTHGYIVQAIDFELNIHKKYKLYPYEKQ
jgi:hypothetical protein